MAGLRAGPPVPGIRPGSGRARPPGRNRKNVIRSKNRPAAPERSHGGARRRAPCRSRKTRVYQGVAGCAKRAMLRVRRCAAGRARIRIDRFVPDNNSYREQTGAARGWPGLPSPRRNGLILKDLSGQTGPAEVRCAAWVSCCTAQSDRRRLPRAAPGRGPGCTLAFDCRSCCVPSRSRLRRRSPDRRALHRQS